VGCPNAEEDVAASGLRVAHVPPCDPPVGTTVPRTELPAHTGPPTVRSPPFTLSCASHNPPYPAAADRGKGRPQADPEGTRSALPATEAAGTLSGVGRASPLPRACRRVGAGFRSAAMRQGGQPRAAPSLGSPPPVPIQSPKGPTRPICLRASPTIKVQVRRHINEEPQVLIHAGEVRDVLRHLSSSHTAAPDLTEVGGRRRFID
jgi:hypothetical protein